MRRNDYLSGGPVSPTHLVGSTAHSLPSRMNLTSCTAPGYRNSSHEKWPSACACNERDGSKRGERGRRQCVWLARENVARLHVS